jgi:DNA-binding transcriptional MerR regulator
MSKPKKDPLKEFDDYKDSLDRQLGDTKTYLRKLQDAHDGIMIDARKHVNYDIANNKEKFGTYIANAFEKHIKDMYKVSGESEDIQVRGLMKRHLGVTKKEIKRIVDTTEDPEDIYSALEQEIKQADTQLKREHFGELASDYIDVDKPGTLEHIFKYLSLDSHGVDVEIAKRKPDVLKQLFVHKYSTGPLHSGLIPAELKGLKKKKPKK